MAWCTVESFTGGEGGGWGRGNTQVGWWRSLTLFDMGDPPQMFLTTVFKCLGGGT